MKQRLLEPVAAYDRIAPEFAQLSQRRKAYLDRIDQLIISAIPSGCRSLLDVGAGTGGRAIHIARACGIRDLVLLEPSAAMRRNWPAHVQAWPIRAEELKLQDGEFDVITCLWNVLGHIFPAGNRTEVLRQFARLLSPHGLVFIDVNHRYNVRHYGVVPTALRIIRDRILPNERNGDVVASWNLGGIECSTSGHVFTDSEFRALAESSGLEIATRVVIDYATGQIRRSTFEGNLLYILRRMRA